MTAVEVAPHRATLVQQAVRGLPVTVECLDGRTVGPGSARVLRPGTGRRPVYRPGRAAPPTGVPAGAASPRDLPPLTRLQRELLASALRAVRPGGVVAYVTCSPHLVETAVTVKESARRSAVGVELVDARPLLPAGMPDLGDGPAVQLWPHRHGTDAMYLALLRRT